MTRMSTRAESSDLSRSGRKWDRTSRSSRRAGLGRARDVQSALQITDADVIDLDLIDADTMIEIIRSVGIEGPDELLYHIRVQADGRPGLAATLSHMCLAGDVRRAISGDGLVDQIAPQLDRMLEIQDATGFLAPFALGGDAGVRLERVADQLHRPLDDVHRWLTQLAAAGVVMERANRAVSVEPAPMRWVLVRRHFFGTGAPDCRPFLNIVEDAHCAIETLIGARARGASVPDLEDVSGTGRFRSTLDKLRLGRSLRGAPRDRAPSRTSSRGCRNSSSQCSGTGDSGALDDANRRISRIGERGAALVKEDELRALAREHHRAVHGRS